MVLLRIDVPNHLASLSEGNFKCEFYLIPISLNVVRTLDVRDEGESGDGLCEIKE